MFGRVSQFRHTVRSGVRLSSTDAFKSMRAKKAEETRRKMLHIGGPLILFLVGGSYLLSVFLGTHMELKDKQNSSTTTRNFDLEEEHKALMKKLNIEDFSLSRIPRPASEDSSAEAGNKTVVEGKQQQKSAKS